ncbi:Relaxase/Mobilisation nuclease domain-containing protein [Chryseobacterium wanjuense]|uniref:Relaxase/Mobilisation nuclease domain-containing protein n=1 Tax=Chryseobacterium wanjuense TaxID=356305 RepID=A0A1I0QF45_9FLAO|nr:conjugal transfer protein MobB [Chryseobacterium wanjuense]SEW25717.1 Relaxase/Mobilisation nuclease domain-containing protein [Chryseobacterium wanjuense]
MIAKIGRGESLYGALSYNHVKVQQENGQVLFTHNMMETPDGNYSVSQLSRSFEPYLIANRNTEKPVLHISLNPDPKDQVSDEKYKMMAQQYMREMGYGNQPFVVFKHTDIERTHIHIVSVCVDEDGKKISDKFEKRRSMKVCRDMEQKYGLIPAIGKEEPETRVLFRPVDYTEGNLKSQMASVLRHLPEYYRFQTLGEYNALLSLFNITTEKVEGELHGKPKHGLIYSALDENGKKSGPPFKASLFGIIAGLETLEKHFSKSKESLKDSEAKLLISNAIALAMKSSVGELDFKELLASQGINAVIRRNDAGRVYGMTFIDHNSKTVWNGSRFGKEFSANIFNDLWQNGVKSEMDNPHGTSALLPTLSGDFLPAEKPHDLFGFLETIGLEAVYDISGFIETTGSLFPNTHGENYEEFAFQKQMKKKKRKKRL